MPPALGPLAEDGGDGALHHHGSESEQEDDGDYHSVESGLGLQEGEEKEQALASEAIVEVRSGGGGGGVVVGPRQLAIGGGFLSVAVVVVARVSFEGESASDRVESDVGAGAASGGGVVDLRRR